MNLENYIESQYRELKGKDLINPEFLDLYSSIEHEKLREILASIHKQFVVCFKSMNERLPTFDNTAHFWADPSRDLIFAIEIIRGLKRSLKNSTYGFEIDNYYSDLLDKCDSFLSKSGGSTLPENMEKVVLYYTEPIFNSADQQKISRSDNDFYQKLKLIGEGSYAKVFKFNDEFYDKDFVLKRAKQDLNAKELERFKREFEEMKRLSSPYIVEVLSYNDERSEYTMEYMNSSLDKYIEKNNNKLTLSERRRLGLQVLRAFGYLESKNLLHRDISPKNILIKEYEDTAVVKVSDFGLVKVPDSSLTSVNTEFKGYFNDPALITEGFDSYGVLHETYALTKLLYYIMTGKTNVSQIKDTDMNNFVQKGLDTNKSRRYSSIEEIKKAFVSL